MIFQKFKSLDMVTFNEPTAGMFIWLKVNGIDDTRKLIYEKALAQEVLLLPGSAFFVDQSKTYPFVRVSYSLSTPEQIETVNLF
jgi:kynurenine/2-aminoadipate aminotransferase